MVGFVGAQARRRKRNRLLIAISILFILIFFFYLPFIDIYSNGFKLRSNWAGVNGDGSDYVYYAVGQSLVGSNNVPCTAR